MDERDQKYFRPITHYEYKRKIPFEKEDGSTWVRKCIYNDGYYPIDDVDDKIGEERHVDDKYYVKDSTDFAKFGFRATLYFTLPLFVFFFYDEPIFGEYIGVTLFFFFSLFFNLYLLYYTFFHPPYIYITA